MDELDALAAELGERLKARKETVAVAESSSGGLISAALLSVPGASAYYRGGLVLYTYEARAKFLSKDGKNPLEGAQSGSEDYAAAMARAARATLNPTWAIGEVGTAGLKDRHAVTRQQVSVPAAVEERLDRLNGDGITLLRFSRHGNKLKLGHLADEVHEQHARLDVSFDRLAVDGH